MQPHWLEARQQRSYTWRAVRLPAIVIGILISILVHFFFSASSDPPFLLQSAVVGGLLGGLWHGPFRGRYLEEDTSRRGGQGQAAVPTPPPVSSHQKPWAGAVGAGLAPTRRPYDDQTPILERWHEPVSEKGSPREHRHTWGTRLLKRLATSACLGLICGLSFGFYLGPYYTLSQWQTDALSYGVVIGLSSLLLQYLLTIPFHPDASSGNSATERRKRVVRFGSAMQGPRALLVAAVIWMSFGLRAGLSFGLTYGLSDALGDGLIPWLTFGLSHGLGDGLSAGLSYVLISLTLAAQMGEMRQTEHMRWTWRNLRRGLFNSRHLRITLLLACISVIIVGLSDALGYGLDIGLRAGLSFGPSNGLSNGLGYGLSTGLSVGLIYWFLRGLYQGIAQERIEDQDRHVANQRTNRSLHNSVIMGIIGGAVIGSVGILSIWLIPGLTYGLIFGLNAGLRYGRNDGLDNGLTWMRTGFRYGLTYGLNNGLLIAISGALLICMLTGGLAVWRYHVMRSLLTPKRGYNTATESSR